MSTRPQIKKKSVAEHLIHFQFVAEETSCGEKPLRGIFINTLCDQLKYLTLWRTGKSR